MNQTIKPILIAIFLLTSLIIPQTAKTSEEWIVYDENITIKYPVTFKVKNITAIEHAKGLKFKASRNTPSALFTVRHEPSLQAYKSLGKGIIDGIISFLEINLKKKYPNYKTHNFKKFNLNGYDMAMIDFTYTGTDKKTIIQQRLVIVEDALNSAAYYLIAQSQKSDFESLNKKFNKMIHSFQIKY